jgi:acetyltransferase-like isoleucine patch superfamily enzyme
MNTIYIHPTAIVETRQIGRGTRIWAFTHIMKDVSLGTDCNVGEHCFIEAGVMIGNNVTIKNGNMIWEGVTIEDGVFVGPQVLFTNDLYPRSPRLPQASKRYSDRQWLRPIRLGYGTSLGAGSVMLAGVTTGEFSMVGAAAVVTKNVPAYALMLGAPASVRGWVCTCGQPLRFQAEYAQCGDCGLEFIQDDGLVSLMHRRVGAK